jgi:ABC-2 type transport system permease protein
MFLAQLRSELLMRWRIPAFSIANLALPIMFFTFFALPVAGRPYRDGVTVGAYLLASFGAYAVGSVAVYGFGIGVASERGMKVDLLMRATPLPAAVHLAAKLVTALAFSLLSLVLLIAYGTLAGGVERDPAVWAAVIARLLAGSPPFITLGFAIGYLAGPHAAPGVANLVYLPLAFGSGLFVPMEQLPGFVQAIAPFLPNYHYAQLAWSAVGAGSEALGTSLAWLAFYTVVFGLLALRGYRRDASRKFG